MQNEQVCQFVDTFCRFHPRLHRDHQSLTAVLVQDIQYPERFPVIRPVMYKVI